MYLYWRIQQDLNYLGQVIQFHDPAMVRSLKQWIKKNYSSLQLAEGLQQGWHARPSCN